MKTTYSTTRKYICLLTVCLISAITGAAAIPPDAPKRETRAVWLTTFSGLDWPKTLATSEAGIAAQKAELCHILDRLQEVRINTVLLQTRVRGSVIYPSAIEPWDGCLTGTAGRSPGYDPLAFAIEECHRRGMELHAWLVTIPCFKTSSPLRKLNRSVLRTHPNLCVRHNGSWYLNPGLPETADYLSAICKEIAENYDVDGIHFDYIRYPENATRFNDKATYRKYGHKQDKADWRRDNITRCVRAMYRTVKAVKPWIKVSSSPVGKYSDLSRYPSYSWNAYSAVYQDAQKWLHEGIQDALFPMMYFRGNHFYPFAADWKEHDCGRPVVPGLGVYMLSAKEKDWPLDDIVRELYFTRSLHLGGQAYFRYAFLDENHKGLFDYLKQIFYPYPALPAACNAYDSIPPSAPGHPRWQADAQGGNALCWTASTDNVCGHDVRYNIYAAKDTVPDISTARHLIATGLRDCRFPASTVYCQLNGVHFAITATDRFGNESAPARLPAALPTAMPDSVRQFLRHDGTRLSVPDTDSPFLAIVDMFGRIVRTPANAPDIRIDDLPAGLYQLRTLKPKGRSEPLGFFMKLTNRQAQ